MKWFGNPWPSDELRAAVCEDDRDRVPPPPPEEECGLCGKPIGENAQGVVVPHVEADRTSPWLSWVENRYIHLGCLLSNIGV